MPIMNGYVCAQKIKSLYDKKSIFQYCEGEKFCPYMVAYSAHVDNEIEERGLECGFN